jgi:hypothetical protein
MEGREYHTAHMGRNIYPGLEISAAPLSSRGNVDSGLVSTLGKGCEEKHSKTALGEGI